MEQNDNNTRIAQLEKALSELSDQFYRNNFPTQQDFTKYSNFTNRLKVPHYDSLPPTCAVGEIGEANGKLYICGTADTWSVVGSQS